MRYVLSWASGNTPHSRTLFLLSQVDKKLATKVAEGLGTTVPAKLDKPMNRSVPATPIRRSLGLRATQAIKTSHRLSMVDNLNFRERQHEDSQGPFLIADGFDPAVVSEMKQALLTAVEAVMTVTPRLAMFTEGNGEKVKADLSFLPVRRSVRRRLRSRVIRA